MASGYEMKAKPGPGLTTSLISSAPVTKARCPKIPKIMNPDNNDVKVSKAVTMLTSLGFGRRIFIRTCKKTVQEDIPIDIV